MRHLAGFRDSLSFRTEREATQPYALVPRENALFLVKCLSQPLWTSSNLFTFSHLYQLEVIAAIDTMTTLKPVKELKHLQQDLSGIALPERRLVIQKPAVHVLSSLIRCLPVGLWSSRGTYNQIKELNTFLLSKVRGRLGKQAMLHLQTLEGPHLLDIFRACLMDWASQKCNGCFPLKHSWRGGSNASMPNTHARMHAHQIQHQMFRALSPPEMGNVTLLAWKIQWTLTTFHSFNIRVQLEARTKAYKCHCPTDDRSSWITMS